MNHITSSRRCPKKSQQQKLIDVAAEIINEPTPYYKDKGYMPKINSLVGLPHKDPGVREFTRKNGYYTLTLSTNYANIGLPYGNIPRLLLAWITTEVINRKSQEILLGGSLSEFMRHLGLVPTGGRWGTIKRLKDQALKLFSTTLSYEYSEKDVVSDGTSLTIAHKRILWWDNTDMRQSIVKLTKEFYDEIIKASIPLDMRALKALKRSPMALDLYVWLAQRLWRIEPGEEVLLNFEMLQMQFGCGYAMDAAGRNNFQKSLSLALRKVKEVYPHANAELIRGRLQLLPSKPPIPPRK